MAAGARAPAAVSFFATSVPICVTIISVKGYLKTQKSYQQMIGWGSWKQQD